jgi:CubicO group peptidase (beta-lactamase class C family)
VETDVADPLQAETMRRNNILLLLIAVLFCFASCNKAVEPGPEDPNEFEYAPPYAWQTASPQSVGLDSALIAGALNEINTRPYIFSFLIVKDGKLVIEDYNSSATVSSDYDVRSVSKAFISALVGIALREGFIDSLGQRIFDFFPEYNSSVTDARKLNITVEHLLTMRGGFDYTEGADYSHLFTPAADWVKAILELPLKYNPGEQFYYSTPQTHLLAVIIARASGMSTLKFAQQYLFRPLSIGIRDWCKDPQGNYYGGTGMSFTARDLARFGNLYLHNGTLDGVQIVQQDWIDKSLKPRNATNTTWGPFQQINYGYQWWTHYSPSDSLYMAAGHAGQFIINVPKYAMTIVSTTDANVTTEVADSQFNSILEIASLFVLPAAR